ncbi:MAG: hypothetical protein ACI8RT_001266, partial [Candidatus Azotimanducaceae bacterium]
MKKLSALVGFLSFFFVGTVAAEESELSYSNVAVSYYDGDILDVGADGFGIRGSIGFASSWFASLEYNAGELEGVDLDLDEIALDIGYHWGIGAKTDLVASIGYSRIELDVDVNNLQFLSGSASGYDLNFGVRGKPVDQFEYGVFVTYYNGGDFNSDFQLLGEARYHFSAPISAGVRYRNNDDFDYWGVDVRY